MSDGCVDGPEGSELGLQERENKRDEKENEGVWFYLFRITFGTANYVDHARKNSAIFQSSTDKNVVFCRE